MENNIYTKQNTVVCCAGSLPKQKRDSIRFSSYVKQLTVLSKFNFQLGKAIDFGRKIRQKKVLLLFCMAWPILD